MILKNYFFKDVCETITDYVANGSFKSLADNVIYSEKKDYARLIRLVDNNCDYNEKNAIWVSKQSYDFLKKSALSGDEIIISNVGANLGTVFKCPKLSCPMTLGPNSILVKTNDLCDQDYLYYYLKSKQGYNTLMSLVSGSAMPKFNKTDLRNITISIPEKKYQAKAAKLLSKIEQKIEINKKINNNLYNIALSLISEDFQNNEFIKLNKVIKFIKGKKPSNISADKKNGYMKYLTIACLNNQEITYANPDKTLLTESDILMVMDGASSGDVYYSNKGIVGSTLAKIELINNDFISEYLYFVLKKHVKTIQDKTTGSAIPHTDKVFVGNLDVPIINKDKQKKYIKLINKINKNNEQNEVLSQLRDTLLPKLMNGEIDLDSIEV